MSSSKANKVKTNKYGESALHVAIKKGDYEKAKSLIDESDADVNMKDNAGEFSVKATIYYYYSVSIFLTYSDPHTYLLCTLSSGIGRE